MNGAEALTRLIEIADRWLRTQEVMNDEEQERSERDKLAASVGQAMLNTMLPIARFRVHVEVTVDHKPTTTHNGHKEKLEYTVSALTANEIRAALLGLSMSKVDAYVTLWEQKAYGAEMLAGFQGSTKTLLYRNFLKSLDEYEAKKETQQ